MPLKWRDYLTEQLNEQIFELGDDKIQTSQKHFILRLVLGNGKPLIFLMFCLIGVMTFSEISKPR